MAKTLDYQITLYPAHRDGAFVVTQFHMMATYPEKRVQAAGMDDLIDKVTQFAMEHGESCSASRRRCGLKPPKGNSGAASRNGRPPLSQFQRTKRHDTSD